MPEFSGQVINLSRSFNQLHKRTAPDQGGLLTGKDPTAFDPADPLRLWIIQVGVIIITTQILSLGLRKLRQPRVIAEVLGGILLGPTAFGRIPGFSEHIFPTQSIPYLSLVANIGLCLFLFLVGLEIDTAIIRRHARLSATVAAAGIVIPFGFGAALAVPLYHRFIDESQVSYTHFMLFTGVAYSITAFPVLCRILTELKLLDTTVGVVVLSAGVGNDIIGWVLLALSVALVNAGSGLTALWILLACLGWTLLMLIIVQRVLFWLARRTGSVENGPTIFFMTITTLILFASAFFTDVIGVHAIFGAFLAGIIVPREGGLAIALTEKLEDMVSVIFLPLYFTISGLSTDLGLLNTWTIWGFTAAICALAFTGKFGGCTLAARYAGFNWREATTIGSLMSCKGLIELIVLNVGLSANILTRLVFSMFVLEALLLTFATTPTVTVLYPLRYRVRASAVGSPFANVSDGDAKDDESAIGNSRPSTDPSEDASWKRRFTVILDKLEHLPSMMAITHLLQPPPPAYSQLDTLTHAPPRTGNDAPAHFAALRLIELADRPSDVMKSSATEALLHTDPLLSIFRTFADLNGLPVSTALSIVPFDELAASVGEHARSVGSQLVLLPWISSMQTHADSAANATDAATSGAMPERNPFDTLFRTDRSASLVHSHFVRGVFAQAGTNVALLVGRGPREPAQHVFLPFIGGPDDRLALEFVVQLCASARVRATVLRLVKSDDVPVDAGAHVGLPEAAHLAEENAKANALTVASTTGFPDTMYGHASTQTRLQSETADGVAWARFAAPVSLSPVDAAALARVTFEELTTPTPLHTALQRARALGGRTLVVVGRARRLAAEDHTAELRVLGERDAPSELRKTLGDTASAFVLAGVDVDLVVMQAPGTRVH
ncbi:Sodium/hydrogen exchanger family-domain-containing protein [Gloeopeniophorella convolvens]|nr:Sodium/hydrogen exchanger family-domain-containing protein [Gloeopeniophorella convolvens]